MILTQKYKFKKRELTDSPPDITATEDNWDKAEAELDSQAKQITGCNTEIGKLKEDISNIDVSWDAITGKYRDARAEGNKPPSWYQGKGMVIELANFSDVLVGGTELCILTTYTAWHDVTGGVVQFAMNKNVMYMRSSVSASAWTVFTPQRDGGNADTVDGKHASEFLSISGEMQHLNKPLGFNVPNANNEVGIEAGNGDGASFSTCNLDIYSWFGIGMYPKTAGKYGTGKAGRSIVFDPRSGTVSTKGHIKIGSTGDTEWHEFATHRQCTDGTFRKVALGVGHDGAGVIETYSNDAKVNRYDFRSGDIFIDGVGLKQSVVNGKQLVVNALNDKYGYNTGLTTTHTHQDYAWWIGQIPTKAKQLIVDTTIICGNPTETAKYLDVNLADLGYFSNSYYEILLTNRTNSSSSIVSIYKKAYSSSGSYVYQEKVANGTTFIYPVSTTVAQILVSTTSASGHYEVKIYKCGGN